MTAQVKIISGTYRGSTISNTVFPMLRPVVSGAKGDFVTVDASEKLGAKYKKIRVMVNDYEYVGVEQPVKKRETDEQIISRIEERFEILDEMTRATVNGDVRAMIVTGPPGVGKSFGVERELEKSGLLDDLAGRPRKYEVVKGAMTPIGLYCKLYEYSDKNNVLVFDDCDSVLMDDLSLNILRQHSIAASAELFIGMPTVTNFAMKVCLIALTSKVRLSLLQMLNLIMFVALNSKIT